MISTQTLRRAAGATLATAALLAIPATSASALPVFGHSGALCYYGGVSYSEGAIIQMNGAKYICRNGSWQFFSSGFTAVYAR